MAQIAIIAFFFLINALLVLATGKRVELSDALQAETRDETLHQLAAAVNNFRHETGTYPANLDALATASGYEFIQGVKLPFQSMAVADNIADENFRFSRVTVFVHDSYNPAMSDVDFLAASNNACGTGAFATAGEWCAPADGATRWWKQESREVIASEVQRERRRLVRLLQKFNAWYNDDITVSTKSGVWGNNYPNPGAPSATLVALAGFTQNAKNCSGMWTWSRIPIDCSDLYSIWGTPTVYNYVSPTHIVLMSQSPFIKADGSPLYISTEESL